MQYIAHCDSPLGGITLASNGEALTGLWFDGQKHFGSTLGEHPSSSADLPVFEETRRWLDVYFMKNEDSPDAPTHSSFFTLHSSFPPTPPLSLRGTTFLQRVWKELLSIPYGQTVTYGELARRLGCRSAQAVGGAVGRNPISIIIPCHRVVGANGSLTGYAAGLDRKRTLLALEIQKNIGIK